MANRLHELGARGRMVEASDVPEFFTHPLCHGPKRNYAGRPTVIAKIGAEDALGTIIRAVRFFTKRSVISPSTFRKAPGENSSDTDLSSWQEPAATVEASNA